MVVVRGLIWVDWNRQHLAVHEVVPEEVEEVCHSRYTAVESYRCTAKVSIMSLLHLRKETYEKTKYFNL